MPLFQFFTICISIRLSDTEQNKCCQKLPPVGCWTHNLWIITLMLCQLSWAGSCWTGDFWSKLCFMHHFTCWTLLISRNNTTCLYKGLNDSHRQPNSDLAQSLMKFILFCVTLDVSDNLRETRQISLSWKTQLPTSFGCVFKSPIDSRQIF